MTERKRKKCCNFTLWLLFVNSSTVLESALNVHNIAILFITAAGNRINTTDNCPPSALLSNESSSTDYLIYACLYISLIVLQIKNNTLNANTLYFIMPNVGFTIPYPQHTRISKEYPNVIVTLPNNM